VLTIGTCEIWGGKETQVWPRADEFNVVISLLGRIGPRSTKFSISRGSRRVFAKLTEYQQHRNNILAIDWPDMSAPALDLAFWQALVTDLSHVQGKAVLYCMGGHGRTGTALVALAHVSQYRPALDSGDLVQWVRTHYCADAVETTSQVDYLRRVIGAKTAESPTRTTGSSVVWPQGRSYLDLRNDSDDFYTASRVKK